MAESFIISLREGKYLCVCKGSCVASWITRKLSTHLVFTLRKSGRGLPRGLVNSEFGVSIETTDNAWPITRAPLRASINPLINILINSFDRF